jgi:hypothetical protein
MALNDKVKDIGEKAQDLGTKGFQASKSFLSKAGAKAQYLGEQGVLVLEIKQLDGQLQKLTSRLGSETYKALVENTAGAISADTPEIKAVLAEIASVKETLANKEEELKKKA